MGRAREMERGLARGVGAADDEGFLAVEESGVAVEAVPYQIPRPVRRSAPSAPSRRYETPGASSTVWEATAEPSASRTTRVPPTTSMPTASCAVRSSQPKRRACVVARRARSAPDEPRREAEVVLDA